MKMQFLHSGHAGDGKGDKAGTGFYVYMDVLNLPNSGRNGRYLTFGSHQERGD